MEITQIFKALGDPTRLRIFNLLLHFSALNVNDLVSILHLPQSKISRHLAYLRMSDLVTFNRRDKWVYYRVNPRFYPEFQQVLKNILTKDIEMEADIKRGKELVGDY